MILALKNSFSPISTAFKQYWRGFLFIFLFLAPIGCSANIFINEIAWMGTPASSNDEWIELFNDSIQPVDLSGWEIITKDKKMTISLDGKIEGGSFYLLERTDDNSVPNILADKIYTGSLANTGEALDLYDNLGKIVDSIDCGSGWPAGDNATKKTMERKNIEGDSSVWATSIDIGGTPKSKNSLSDSSKSIDLSENKINTPIKEEISTKIYPKGIIINEILPSPEGSDEQNEYIEIYNQNAEKIDLSEWKLADSIGKSTTFVFPEKTSIDPSGFLIFFRNTTKIILNNDNDEISLINPNGEVVDRINYSKAPINQSYSKINNEWTWNRNITPGSKNTILSPAQEKGGIVKNNVEKFFESKNSIASIAPQLPKNFSKKSISTLLMATGLALTSGIIILFIKKKLTK